MSEISRNLSKSNKSQFSIKNYSINRILFYALLVLLTAGGYALLVSGLSLLISQPIAPNNPIIVGIIIFVIALAINPIRERLKRAIDAIFLRNENTFREKLLSFSHEIGNAADLPAVLATFRSYIEENLAPDQVHIFTLNLANNEYTAAADAHERPTSDLHFSLNSPLAESLNTSHEILVLNDAASLPAPLEKDRARLALLAAQVFIPLPGRERLTGWVAIGAQKTYTSREMQFLKSLCDQSAIAIERAQILARMENRVQEMNVLARVAQGVNVTLNFDDILELVYAQTNQVIPTRDFFLMIFDQKSSTYTYAFYLENDERVVERENKPVPAGQGLEQEIIKTRSGILTDDYAQECRKRGLAPIAAGVLGWIGVPLNTGAETIGAISLGIRSPALSFSTDQLDLLQAIADQTAGAIVKARLLQEAERRARQLTTLNEVTRQLTTTLDLEPLLGTILQNAMDILNCEAGSLMLVDDQTQELIFHVTAGPVAQDLVGKRLPPGTGVVGKAVKTHQPLIVNNVQESPDWYANTDRETGFVTRSLLVTPLQVKEEIIGVIELINRRDRLPFSEDDQALLAAFASQAAAAIENARSYMMTDQALAARVEELSVMQRIDRELNTSLDIGRTMRITLEWALRQSKADAGLIGIIENKGVRVMSSQGYTHELDPFLIDTIPLDLLSLQIDSLSGQPERLQATQGVPLASGLLEGCFSQIIVPIRREISAIGIILLESRKPEAISDEGIAFLSRLSDHATIAISNAQLYQVVQDANNAKSEFVSFVAHELKNPMTSIKGYTELLAAGAVGPVSSPQGNFLSTIRANIDRMNTLVSDLNDLSKIEAGRLRLDFKALQVSEAVEEAVRSAHRQLEEKNQKLTVELPQDLPPVWADHTRLTQALVNLISNANKYTPPSGQILVSAETCADRWGTASTPMVVHIWVKDNGIGISDEDQQKIFQKFFRSDDTKTREVPGTGLGLNITRSLVEMQGGRIWFESQFRQGTTFHFTMPIAS
jgi:signal transduction histidine kinase